jgi:N-acetylmuramoyl-L-alanine amidase
MQWLLIFSLFFSVSVYANITPYRIVIDPGHGGMDTGASLKNARESEITLQISQKTKERFQNQTEFEVFLTRESDKVVPLFERVEFSKKKKANLFLSIHANSSTDLSARGAEFYFQSQMPADEETLFLANRENNEVQSPYLDSTKGDLNTIVEDLQRTSHIYSSQIFAETLLKQWKKYYKVRSQPIRQGPFHVLVNVPIPSILIEVGFITHSGDRENMSNPAQQARMADIIYNSIVEFKEKMDKGHFSSHIISHANR